MHLHKTCESCQGTLSRSCRDWRSRRSRQKNNKKKHSPVSLCESACHKDAPSPCPLFSMTALLRRRHPRGAEDRQGQQPKRAIWERVEPATEKKKKNATSLREVTSLQTRRQSDQINWETCTRPASFVYSCSFEAFGEEFKFENSNWPKVKGPLLGVDVCVPKMENHQLQEAGYFTLASAGLMLNAQKWNKLKLANDLITCGLCFVREHCEEAQHASDMFLLFQCLLHAQATTYTVLLGSFYMNTMDLCVHLTVILFITVFQIWDRMSYNSCSVQLYSRHVLWNVISSIHGKK